MQVGRIILLQLLDMGREESHVFNETLPRKKATRVTRSSFRDRHIQLLFMLLRVDPIELFKKLRPMAFQVKITIHIPLLVMNVYPDALHQRSTSSLPSSIYSFTYPRGLVIEDGPIRSSHRQSLGLFTSDVFPLHYLDIRRVNCRLASRIEESIVLHCFTRRASWPGPTKVLLAAA